jgi:adenosylcobyric acid synthase
VAKSLMVMGTASNVGKSVLCTALCRILVQDGYRVAPFKAQNMSLNSAVTPTGREIGRAQAVQAAACGIAANEHMNPVLLKPTSLDKSQVMLQGRVYETTSARAYFQERTGEIWDAVVESYEYLAARYDVLVIEGAGSPVEMNLKSRDIANMRTAELADADVLLVADIERGGIFAAVVGTLQLLSARERARIRGVIVNKFRGDRSLFDDGVRLLEELTDVPVLGVIPHLRDLGIEEEDSVALDERRYRSASSDAPDREAVRIAVIQLPHISNFTDFDPLFLEPGVHAYFCRRPEDVGAAHAVLLPGTKNTMEDLQWLRETGFVDVLAQRRAEGAVVFGVCGGYQMLGKEVRDPEGHESSIPVCKGLDWLPVVTTLEREKTTVLVQGHLEGAFAPIPVSGYEIHMGQSLGLSGYQPFATVRQTTDDVTRPDGAVNADGTVMGTYLHGIFDNDAFRQAWLNQVRERFGISPPVSSELSMASTRAQAFDRLATVVREHLEMDAVYRMIGHPPRATGSHSTC